MSNLSGPVKKLLAAGLADTQAVVKMSPAALAEALLASLRHLSPKTMQKISNLLLGLGKEKEASPNLEKRDPTEQKLPANNQTAGREITLDGSPAIEMHVPVNGQIIRAVLSDASFNKSPQGQVSYAQRLGGRLARGEENRAVRDALLEKEKLGTLNTEETKLLEKYRGLFVGDSEGGLGVDYRCHRLHDLSRWLYIFGCPYHGALVVLPLAESK